VTADIRARYDEVVERAAEAARRGGVGRPTIVAVSKTFPADVILRAAEQGVTEIGESRAQELKEKHAVVGDSVRWHFIGHLQTNKVRHVVGVAKLIHSLDRFGLAEAIARRATSLGIVQRVLIEVNIGRDPNKHGVDPAQAIGLATEVAGLDGIEVGGVMAMAPFLEDPQDTRPYFAELRSLSEQLVRRLPEALAISMGMTRDFEVAVEEGATVVRVGEAIFGPRHP
jgi:pyridoxal phosphate enzyme (YggS family)